MFAIGTISDSITIISEDYFVYEVRLDDGNSTINQLNLVNEPTPLWTKYPLLYNDPKFTQSIGYFYKVFFFKDNQSNDYISLTGHVNITNILNGSLIYNFKNGKVNTGLTYNGDENEILISTDLNLIVFSVKMVNDEVKLGSYKIVGDNLPESLELDRKYRSICLLKENILTINPDGKQCQQAAKWNVITGFTAKKQFYLISPKMVYIFSEDLFDNEEKEYSFEQIPLDKFLKCSNTFEYSSGLI